MYFPFNSDRKCGAQTPILDGHRLQHSLPAWNGLSSFGCVLSAQLARPATGANHSGRSSFSVLVVSIDPNFKNTIGALANFAIVSLENLRDGC